MKDEGGTRPQHPSALYCNTQARGRNTHFPFLDYMQLRDHKSNYEDSLCQTSTTQHATEDDLTSDLTFE